MSMPRRTVLDDEDDFDVSSRKYDTRINEGSDYQSMMTPYREEYRDERLGPNELAGQVVPQERYSLIEKIKRKFSMVREPPTKQPELVKKMTSLSAAMVP